MDYDIICQKCGKRYGAHSFRGCPKPEGGFDDGTRFCEDLTKLKSGHWYKWVRGKTRPGYFDREKKMDFMLDGNPHICSKGSARTGAFPDSKDPNHAWIWQLDDLREVSAPKGDEISRDVVADPSVGVMCRCVEMPTIDFSKLIIIEGAASNFAIKSRKELRKKLLHL